MLCIVDNIVVLWRSCRCNWAEQPTLLPASMYYYCDCVVFVFVTFVMLCFSQIMFYRTAMSIIIIIIISLRGKVHVFFFKKFVMG